MATPIPTPAVLVSVRRAISGGALVRAMNRAGVRVRDYIKTTHMGAAQTQERRLARNTGRMERRTVALPARSEDGQTVTATVHIDVPYASLHFTDTGKRETIIVPVHAKALTIPILVNAQKRAPQPARAYDRTVAKGGILYSVDRSGGLLPIFSLRRSVKVPTRVDIQRDIHPTAQRIMSEEIERGIAESIKG